jgi:subtilisin family serine protease
LLVGAALGAATPVRATPVPTGGSIASPSIVSAAIPLGQQGAISVTVQNTSGAPLTLTMFKALAASETQLLSGRGAIGPRQVMLPVAAERLDRQLLTELTSAPGQRRDFIVYLHDQADLSGAYRIAGWLERGQYVYQTLLDHAEQSQRDLRTALTARGVSFRAFWIVNALLVHGNLSDFQALAGRADVALIQPNRVRALAPVQPLATVPTAEQCNPTQPSNPLCWNIQRIGADHVWNEFGVIGQGVVVANLDTGVEFNHPALLARYRGYAGPGQVSHDYNWFDPQRDEAAPIDRNGHGTHTMGTMVGLGNGTAAQPAIGVAPGARWIAAQGCDDAYCTEADLTASAQWILAPTRLDGRDPRPDLRPMIVNNSWGGAGGDNWYAGYTAAWRAAGIFPVFAAGNAQGGAEAYCGTIASPGDYPDVVAVGASDRNDAIARFSLLGPTRDGRVKPDVVGPGAAVVSAFTGSSYRVLSGTSMATPHVAGVVALLWSANPSLIGNYDATYAILRESALGLNDTRCGDKPGASNSVYGHGRVDAYQAVARARVDVPWLELPPDLPVLAAGESTTIHLTLNGARVPGPGTYSARIQIYNGSLVQAPTTVAVTMQVTPVAQQAVVSGRITSLRGGTPLHATVGVKDGLGVATDDNGAYRLILPLDGRASTVDVVASAPAHLTQHQSIELSADRQLDIALKPDQPEIALTTDVLSTTLALGQHEEITVPIGNTGSRPLYYRAQVPVDRFGAWRSDEPGGPTYDWVDLPADAKTLVFGSKTFTTNVPLGITFPFYGYVVTDTLVTAHGMLGFAEPVTPYEGMSQNCLPDHELFFYLLAPFRADLDPSRGGTVRYGTVPERNAFVLSYENVPLRNGPPDQTYTFQALLYGDGRVVYQYRRLAALPQRLSIGVQRTALEYLSIGCGASTPVYDGLAIELRPQPSTTFWIASDTVDGVVPPGEARTIRVKLDWARPGNATVYRGRLVITSSDSWRPLIERPAELRVAPALHESWMVTVRN